MEGEREGGRTAQTESVFNPFCSETRHTHEPDRPDMQLCLGWECALKMEKSWHFPLMDPFQGQ